MSEKNIVWLSQEKANRLRQLYLINEPHAIIDALSEQNTIDKLKTEPV